MSGENCLAGLKILDLTQFEDSGKVLADWLKMDDVAIGTCATPR